ncbi:hypothetical protein EB820_16650 [Brevibacillus agri]|uniref:Uncharacterized protein n=1 Tax=Brevibacillus agri TaxID=51101 RepID=A0A3M8AQ87_9BACL|nr:hypothetical protein BA6348_17570 [Brevibacillus agri]RNB53219.1 hypothetical protein EB820_16650 [Brevibacillus agri]
MRCCVLSDGTSAGNEEVERPREGAFFAEEQANTRGCALRFLAAPRTLAMKECFVGVLPAFCRNMSNDKE